MKLIRHRTFKAILNASQNHKYLLHEDADSFYYYVYRGKRVTEKHYYNKIKPKPNGNSTTGDN